MRKFRMSWLGWMVIVMGMFGRTVVPAAPRAVEKGADGDFALAAGEGAAPILVSLNDAEVVRVVADCLAGDIEAVCGSRSEVVNELPPQGAPALIIAGTMGLSEPIDALVQSGKLDPGDLKGKWESFVIETVDHPMPGVAQALVIAGSDRRGTAYGLFEISRAMGVSPWIWWADVPPASRASLYISAGRYESNPPTVKYRGIFINDEDWGLQEWSEKNYESGEGEVKDIGPKSYARVFELLLRLRANYCWPAMHPSTKAFNTYPENKVVADRYAIVMGASHCEPMLCNNVSEWDKKTMGEWNYETNADTINAYWDKRVSENGKYENVYTVGMRGIHDSNIPGGGTTEEKVARLERVIDFQRSLLAKYVNPDPSLVPQIFCPYKEVLGLYQAGMKLPDDVTIVWADDNFGYIRQVSTPGEQLRSGGAGVYYHFSYWGRPEDFLWISSISPAQIAFEMNKALAYGADRLWVFNVGDIKPIEKELEFSMDLAWDATDWTPETAYGWTRVWAAKTFGEENADEIASILNEYYKLAQRGMPEHLGHLEFNDVETADRLAAYCRIGEAAEALHDEIPEKLKDAYFQLVLYPVRGAQWMNEKILYARESRELALAGEPQALVAGARATMAYNAIQRYTERYNKKIAGGKWDYMMSSAPRRRPVFNPASVAKPGDVQAGKANPKPVEAKPGALLEVPACDFKAKKDGDGAVLTAIPGLYEGALMVTPFTAPSLGEGEIDKAPRAEYTLDLPEGAKTLTVRCMPTHRIHEGRGLRCAVSVGGAAPQILDLNSPSQSKTWKANVLRGYSEASVSLDGASGETVTIYFLDPGLVLESLVVH